MIFYRSPIDNKTLKLISAAFLLMSSSPCLFRFFSIISRALTMIGITVTSMSNNSFSSLARKFFSFLYGLVGFYGISTIGRLFNAKSFLYIYIKYIWFGLVGFYGISTIGRLFNAKSSYIYMRYSWFVNISWIVPCIAMYH